MKKAGVTILGIGALLALGGPAQATTLTSPAGTQVGVGTKVHAPAEGTVKIDGTVVVTCQKSTLEGEVANAGSASATVTMPLSKLTLEECGVNTVTVLKAGTLELHNTEQSNGTLTSTGAEITVLTHNILGTVHCIYTTNATDIGTFTGSTTTEATSTLELGASPIPRTSTDFGCGSTSELKGNYKFTSPDYLDVDSGEPTPTTPLTSPAGTNVEVGTKIHAANEEDFKLDGTINIICKKSTVEGSAAGTESATVTLSNLTFEECGKNTVTVLGKGSLELHATGAGNGTITSTGAEITVQTHNILGTVHCIYYTEGTDLGTFTGSKTTGGTATWFMGGPESEVAAELLRRATDFGCGSTSAPTGSYKFTSPDYLDVD